jgi:hypothetical protein
MHNGRRRRNGDPELLVRKQPSSTCTIEGCEARPHGYGMCIRHYVEWRQRSGTWPRCGVAGCGRWAEARSLCSMHRNRFRCNGDASALVRPKGWTNRHGYRLVFRPEHPNANRGGYILEHRLVMSEQLGRPLTAHEDVHHKNGIRADNRPENLELRPRHHGRGQDVADMIAYAIELLRRYRPDLLATTVRDLSPEP